MTHLFKSQHSKGRDRQIAEFEASLVYTKFQDSQGYFWYRETLSQKINKQKASTVHCWLGSPSWTADLSSFWEYYVRLPLSDSRNPERTLRLLFLLGPLLNITVTGQLAHKTSSSLWWWPKQRPTERMPTLMSMASLESVLVELLSDPLEILAATLGLDHNLWFLATSLPLKLTALKAFLPVFNPLHSYFHWACPSFLSCSRRSPHCGRAGQVSPWQGSGNYHVELFLLFPAIQGPTSFPSIFQEFLYALLSSCWVVC